MAVNDVSADRAHSTAAQIESRGGRAEAFAADIRSESAVTQMIEAVLIKMGRIDILYNNSGIYPNRVLIDMTDAEWDRVWDTTVKGIFHVSRDVARHMISRGGPGKIVNPSSTAALSARIGASHYCASKAAVSMFTRVLALELAPYRINVNAVAPGLIEVSDWGLAPEYAAKLVNDTPWGRVGSPADISRVVRFLSSDEADFLTGEIVVVHGGFSVGQNLPLS